MPWPKHVVTALLVLVGIMLLSLVGMVGVGQLFSHPRLAILAVIAVTVLGSAAKWRMQDYTLTRPWLWRGAPLRPVASRRAGSRSTSRRKSGAGQRTAGANRVISASGGGAQPLARRLRRLSPSSDERDAPP